MLSVAANLLIFKFRDLMSPFGVINREYLRSFLDLCGQDSRETVLDMLSQNRRVLEVMKEALYVVSW
jgi:hypothetical protein